MANKEHLAILKQGMDAWNKWRVKNPDVSPHLGEEILIRADLRGVNLRDVKLIGAATGLKIDLEGIYNWIAFLPSRQDPRLPVANRYFGAFRDGEVKIRGIEARRSDTPKFTSATRRRRWFRCSPVRRTAPSFRRARPR